MAPHGRFCPSLGVDGGVGWGGVRGEDGVETVVGL